MSSAYAETIGDSRARTCSGTTTCLVIARFSAASALIWKLYAYRWVKNNPSNLVWTADPTSNLMVIGFRVPVPKSVSKKHNPNAVQFQRPSAEHQRIRRSALHVSRSRGAPDHR